MSQPIGKTRVNWRWGLLVVTFTTALLLILGGLWIPMSTESLGTEEAHALAYSASARLLAFSTWQTGEGDSTILVCQESDRKPFKQLKAQAGALRALSFSPHGEYLASAGDYRLFIWKTEDWSFQIFELSAQIVSVRFSPRHNIIAVALAANQQGVFLWDLRTGQQKTLQDDGWNTRGLLFSPDGSQVLTYAYPPIMTIWDTSTARKVASLDIGAASSHPQGTSIVSTAFSPNARLLAVGDLRGQLSVWDYTTLKKRWTVSAHDDAIDSVVFLTDTRLATASAGELKIWDFDEKQLITRVPVPDSTRLRLLFLPRERLLVTGAIDHQGCLRSIGVDR